MEKTLIQYATELVAKNAEKQVSSCGYKYSPSDSAQVFEVFYRKIKQYVDNSEESLGQDLYYDYALGRAVANEEPVKPAPPGKAKKLFLKAFGIPQDRLDSLWVEDFVKVADVKAASLAAVIVRMQSQNWRHTEYRGRTSGKVGIDLMHALGTDHISMVCGDVIKTPTSKYLEFVPEGFRQVNFGELPNRATKRRQGYTYVVEYIIPLESGDDIVMEAFFKTKTEPSEEDISNYINQENKRDSTRKLYLIKTDIDDPIPTIMPLPYRITKLKMEQGSRARVC